jgi:hypothetical protein
LSSNSTDAIASESIRGGLHTGWFRFLAPSVSDLFFVVIMFSLSCGSFGSRLLGDAGIGWHIRNGEQILHTRAITRTDPFSSTMGGHIWYSWEWLYDIVIASIHHWLGLNGVALFTAIVTATTFCLALRIALKRGGGLPIALLLLLIAIGAASIHFLARPHVLSWLFAVIWFDLLESDASMPGPPSYRHLIWYPLLMLLWTNLHGGFLIGFVLVAFYSAGAAIQLIFSRKVNDAAPTRGKLRYFAMAFGLSLIASLINPFGYELYSHIYGYLGNRFLMDHIDEFLSPNFHLAAQKCFAAILLITLVALATYRQKLNPARLLVVLFAAYSGLYSSRNLPVSAILLVLITAPMLTANVARGAGSPEIAPRLRELFSRLTRFSNRMNATEMSLHWHVWPVLAIILGIICAHGGKLGNHQWMNSGFSPKRFPVQATDFIESRRVHDPIFCPDYWGGYLIYRLYPQSKVVIDDRHDLYGENFLKQYLRVIHVTPEWSEMLDRQHVNWILVPTQSSLSSILRESPQWKPDYEDGTAELFERLGHGTY